MSAPRLDQERRRSIPTRYNGTLFRSKLEADWARVFDALGVTWEYEREGVYFGDQFYLPDFWLPRSRQYVEVKGIFEPDDCRKIQALLSHVTRRPHTGEWCPDLPIVAAVSGGDLYAWERRADALALTFFDFLRRHSKRVVLMQCLACRGWWFADESASWVCQCCGAYDGDGHVANMVHFPLPDFPRVDALRAIPW